MRKVLSIRDEKSLVYFAQIDIGLVHPSVATIYSMEHDAKIREEKENATMLHSRVLEMLSTTKTSIEAF